MSRLQKAIRIYGPNTLVVSSERVNGGVEVIVATDFSQNPDLANPTVNSVASEKEPKAVSRSFSDELAHDSFDEILYESIGKKRSLNSKQEKTLQDPVSTQNIERDGSDQLKKTLVRNAGPKVDKEPTLSHKTFHDTKIRAQKKKLEDTMGQIRGSVEAKAGQEKSGGPVAKRELRPSCTSRAAASRSANIFRIAASSERCPPTSSPSSS